VKTLDIVMPETMPLERLEAEITQLAGNLAAAECRRMLLIAEFDRRAGYEQWGCPTCSHWLNWQCGLDMRAARDRVRVARALEGLPVITEAFAAGRLRYSKARARVRVATAENESSLVMIAEVLSGDADGVCELVNGLALCPETVRYGITIDPDTCIPRC
jgi:hypothetical protein